MMQIERQLSEISSLSLLSGWATQGIESHGGPGRMQIASSLIQKIFTSSSCDERVNCPVKKVATFCWCVRKRQGSGRSWGWSLETIEYTSLSGVADYHRTSICASGTSPWPARVSQPPPVPPASSKLPRMCGETTTLKVDDCSVHNHLFAIEGVGNPMLVTVAQTV